MKYKTLKLFVIVLSTVALAGTMKAAPSAADVGDAETFGHAALYMGAATGGIALSPDCSAIPTPTPSAPGFQCFTLNPAPATTTFDAQDICFIKLPKNATRNVIYPVVNIFLNYQLENTTGVVQPSGRLFFNASLSIESDVLLDPSIIDPLTGLPANGKLIGQFPSIYNDDRRMDVDDRHRQRINVVRVGNTGITKAQLVSQGLSQSVVDDLFKSAMTIRMSVSGIARLVTDASLTGNVRLFGD